MKTILKISVLVFGLIFVYNLSAQEKVETIDNKKDKVEKKIIINNKMIKFSAKKKKRTSKIKSKAIQQVTVGGIDYMRDDREDKVTVTITLENKNKVALKNYKIVIHIYGKSVTDRKAAPLKCKDFEFDIEELLYRGKITKTTDEYSMVYDKSEDVYKKDADKQKKNSFNSLDTINTDVDRTPAFGSRFYGFVAKLIGPDGVEVHTVVWPSGLKKVLEKTMEKK